MPIIDDNTFTMTVAEEEFHEGSDNDDFERK